MTWWQFLIPTVVIAASIRLEALLMGPYWSWIDLYSIVSARHYPGQSIWAPIVRRVAISGVVSFACVLAWPETYEIGDAAVLGTFGACLLLWPIVVMGPPRVSEGPSAKLLYVALIFASTGSAVIGAYVASFIRARGGPAEYLMENLVDFVLVSVVTVFATGFMGKARNSNGHRK